MSGRTEGGAVPPTCPADLRAAIVAEARSWIGTPYRHQQSVKQVGCDCLGLVRGVWREIYGREPEQPPPYSPDWAETRGEETLLNAASRHMQEVPIEVMQPGDVLVFRWRPWLPAKHCGILVTPERMVHAYQSVGRVAEGTLVSQWRARIVAAFAFPATGEVGGTAPPSVLPDISPTRGEIGRPQGGAR